MDNKPPLTPQVKDALINYVKEMISAPNSEVIKQFTLLQPPQSRTVFRGHNNSKTINANVPWFSTSSSQDVAINEFSSIKENNCCVFIIHAVNVPMIDVNYYISDEIQNYGEENEFILLGGGTFYSNKEQTLPGFKSIADKPGFFECWYSLNKNPQIVSADKTQSFDINQLNKLLNDMRDEYELLEIDSNEINPESFVEYVKHTTGKHITIDDTYSLAFTQGGRKLKRNNTISKNNKKTYKKKNATKHKKSKNNKTTKRKH